MSEETARVAFDRLQDALNRAVIADDRARIDEALERPIPDDVLAIPAFHARLRRSRGNTYCRIGDYEAAEAEYSAGFGAVPYAVRGDYLLDWAMASVMRLYLPGSVTDKHVACRRCIQVLEAADEQAGFTADAPYLLASTAAIRAFVYTYLGEVAAARSHLEAIATPTLPTGSPDDPGLASFFTQLPKGLAAALELRDAILVGSLCMAVVTGRENAQLGTDLLPVGQQFATALMLRRDTPKFHNSWWSLIQFAPELSPAFPVVRQFAERMRSGADPDRMARFVDSACA
jgi:hypothetical protein